MIESFTRLLLLGRFEREILNWKPEVQKVLRSNNRWIDSQKTAQEMTIHQADNQRLVSIEIEYCGGRYIKLDNHFPAIKYPQIGFLRSNLQWLSIRSSCTASSFHSDHRNCLFIWKLKLPNDGETKTIMKELWRDYRRGRGNVSTEITNAMIHVYILAL